MPGGPHAHARALASSLFGSAPSPRETPEQHHHHHRHQPAEALAAALFAEPPDPHTAPSVSAIDPWASFALGDDSRTPMLTGGCDTLADGAQVTPLFLSPAEAKDYKRLELTRASDPPPSAASARAAPLCAGDSVLLPRAANPPWRTCFVQGRGWTFVPDEVLFPSDGQLGSDQAEAVADEAAAGIKLWPESTAQADSAPRAPDAVDARYNLVHELYTTEESYASAMRMAITTLLGPAREGQATT